MRDAEIGGRRLVLVRGDITEQSCDALVTAANEGLWGGGGVDGAIHRAAGPRLIEACRAIGGCPTGSAVITPAFDLEENGVGFVIHAVGPIWNGGAEGEPEALHGAYERSLELAEEKGCASLAFPSIGTGIHGFPLDRAGRTVCARSSSCWVAIRSQAPNR
jgi:O-acetyl-ADP-ribose deacetylase (regulator of RNase III)